MKETKDQRHPALILTTIGTQIIANEIAKIRTIATRLNVIKIALPKTLFGIIVLSLLLFLNDLNLEKNLSFIADSIDATRFKTINNASNPITIQKTIIITHPPFRYFTNQILSYQGRIYVSGGKYDKCNPILITFNRATLH